MVKSIKPSQLGKAISEELTVYHKDVVGRLNEAGQKAIKKLVKLTKASAPVGPTGDFKRHITSKETANLNGNTYIWGVRAPEHRITHLLVHGHATSTGGRTEPNPFLQNALDQVLPEYEKEVEEAVKG